MIFRTLLVMLISACNTLELDYRAPAGFDLSGIWVLNEFLSEQPPSDKEIRQQDDAAVRRGHRINSAASSAFLAQDFPVIDSGRMEIEQNADSMGVRYSTGAYSDVSWGRRQRNFWKVHAGWEGDQLVIISRRDDIEGRVKISLEADGARMRVEVDVESGRREVRVVRVFERR